MYDMQMCNEKRKSVIQCFNFIEIINDSRLVISLFDKYAKPLKRLMEGGGEKGRGTHVS